jgi:signal peptidase I
METQEAVAPKRPPLWLRLTFGGNPSWTILRILMLVLVSFVLFKFVLGLIRVTGTSMEPTYHNGQIKVINRLAYRTKSPHRGDVVALYFAGREILLLKRVIGLPGEKVQVLGGRVYINDEKLEEPYARGKIPRKIRPFTLGLNQYWLIGDNREVSEDFTEFDYKIYGKVVF